MKLKLFVVSAFLLSLRWAIPAAAYETGHVSGYLGAKWLNSSDWGGADDQLATGATVDFRNPTWPVNAAFDFIYSYGKDDNGPVDVESTVIEMAPGVRKYFSMNNALSLYVGGGPALMYGKMEQSGAVNNKDSDVGFGLWLGGGALYHLNERMHVGGNLRFSQGDVHVLNKDRNAGGVLLNLLFGVNF